MKQKYHIDFEPEKSFLWNQENMGAVGNLGRNQDPESSSLQKPLTVDLRQHQSTRISCHRTELEFGTAVCCNCCEDGKEYAGCRADLAWYISLFLSDTLISGPLFEQLFTLEIYNLVLEALNPHYCGGCLVVVNCCLWCIAREHCLQESVST